MKKFKIIYIKNLFNFNIYIIHKFLKFEKINLYIFNN